VTMVAAMSLQEVLLETPVGNHSDQFNKAELASLRRTWAGKGHSMLLGDPMVLIRAVGAAEYAGLTQEFCDRNGLRFKAMQEIRKLRKQLANEVNAVLPGLNLVLKPDLEPPTDEQARLLRQIVLAGTPDQIAHKIDISELADSKEKSRLKFAYQTADMDQPVFLKSSSVLKHDLPEWLAYQEVYEVEGKMYMRCATAIDPQWLPVFCANLCQLSPPVTSLSQPWFEGDDVKCHVNGTFGKRSWVLPTLSVAYPGGQDKYKYFAKFLLEGKVLPGLAEYADHLLSPPVVMIKSWGSLHGKRTTVLFEELRNRGCDNRRALVQLLQQEPNYLRSAFLKWVPESMQHQVRDNWTKITTA